MFSRLYPRKLLFWVANDRRSFFVDCVCMYVCSFSCSVLHFVLFDAAIFQTFRYFHSIYRDRGFWISFVTSNRRNTILKLLVIVKRIINVFDLYLFLWSFKILMAYVTMHLWILTCSWGVSCLSNCWVSVCGLTVHAYTSTYSWKLEVVRKEVSWGQ